MADEIKLATRIGRPPIEIDWTKLDICLSLGASLEITANYLGTSEDTVERKIRQEKGLSFKNYREEKMSSVKLKLLQKAQTLALDGNVTMLIFCLKNLCGWADKMEQRTFSLDGNKLLEKAQEMDLSDTSEIDKKIKDLEERKRTVVTSSVIDINE